MVKAWSSQSLSQLAIKCESEWLYRPEKWDVLDELMMHGQRQRNLDWDTEKKRIKRLSWWAEAASALGLSGEGVVTCLHPIQLIEVFSAVGDELVTKRQMEEMFPGSLPEKREEVRELFNSYAGRFEINTPARIAQFFAQVKEEVGDALVGHEESLWYSVELLKANFKRYFNQYPEEAEALGFKRIEMAVYNKLSASERAPYTINGKYAYSQLPDVEGIAKRVYCCNNEAGSFVCIKGGCEEGLMYKGKGFIQLTWKANYKNVEGVLKEKIPEMSFNFMENPNEVLETKVGLLTAMGFWELNKLNAKVAPTTASTDKITAVVNLHTGSYAARREHFENIYRVVK